MLSQLPTLGDLTPSAEKRDFENDHCSSENINIFVAYLWCFLVSFVIPFAAWMNTPGCYQKKSKWTFHEAWTGSRLTELSVVNQRNIPL